METSRGLDTGDSTAEVVEEYLLVVKVAPIYPRRALSRGLEGECSVTYTVTVEGSVEDPVADCTSSVFEQAAIDAIRKFKYRPRTVNGNPVSVTGVQNRFNFELD